MFVFEFLSDRSQNITNFITSNLNLESVFQLARCWKDNRWATSVHDSKSEGWTTATKSTLADHYSFKDATRCLAEQRCPSTPKHLIRLMLQNTHIHVHLEQGGQSCILILPHIHHLTDKRVKIPHIPHSNRCFHTTWFPGFVNKLNNL